MKKICSFFLIVFTIICTSLFIKSYSIEASSFQPVKVANNATNNWEKIKPNIKLSGYNAIQLKDGRVMIIGNESSFIYDYKTNKWTKAAPTIQKTDLTAPVLLQDGRVLVFSGFVSMDYKKYNRAEIYDPKTNKWSLTSKLNIGRNINLYSVLMPNGNVLIAGGSSSQKGDVEIYNPKTNKWTTAGDMNYTPQVRGTFLPLKDGKILSVGGSYPLNESTFMGNTVASALDVYDYKTNKWTLYGINKKLNVSKKLFYLSDGSMFFLGDYRIGIFNFEENELSELPVDLSSPDAIEIEPGKVLITGSSTVGYYKFKPKGYVYTLETKSLKEINMPSILEPILFSLPNGKILALRTIIYEGLSGTYDWNTMYLYTPTK